MSQMTGMSTFGALMGVEVRTAGCRRRRFAIGHQQEGGIAAIQIRLQL
jgi:hypothetical protein